jgi:hypothetical protein
MNDYVGYSKLRPGRIHIYCPKCHRKMSNAHRTKLDPPTAVLMHSWCEKCSDTDGMPIYLDAEGKFIDYWAWWDSLPENRQSGDE